MARCIGITKKIWLCKNKASTRFYCESHKHQPRYYFGVAVFAILFSYIAGLIPNFKQKPDPILSNTSENQVTRKILEQERLKSPPFIKLVIEHPTLTDPEIKHDPSEKPYELILFKNLGGPIHHSELKVVNIVDLHTHSCKDKKIFFKDNFNTNNK